ncbi:MAG: hypothetical protein PVI11_04595 [Candidatus Aminicenantes bacterium]|jgi:hypothetical protein
MEILSFIILVVLSLVGYSGGAVGKAGKYTDVKPQIFDLVIVLLIWGGAVYSRVKLDMSKWLMILVWVVLSAGIGCLTVVLRSRTNAKTTQTKESEELQKNPIKKFWETWKNFSNRMGSFQGRIILSFFFFFFASPFALALKMFSDPLSIKHPTKKSHWLPKKEFKTDLEQFKRQF